MYLQQSKTYASNYCWKLKIQGDEEGLMMRDF